MFIIPTPKKSEKKEGELRFYKSLAVTIPQKYADIAPVMAELFENYTAKKLEISINLSEKLSDAAFVSENGEYCSEPEKSSFEYGLFITQEGASMSFGDRAGLVHALVSFLHLVRIEEAYIRIPCYSIWDAPDMAFRGVHICVFKNTTLSFLKKVIGVCGMMKLSHIVLEFWGTYRYECFPKLAWKGAYTKADIKPLIEYANGLGIEVIPMLNMLGHASQGRICYGKHSTLDNDLSLSYLFEDDGWSWCTTNEKTLDILAKCTRELCDLCGESKFFHIGFDEAYTFASCERCSKFDRNELMKKHLINITNDLKTLGRRPIMWADMMIDSSLIDGKNYEINDKGEHAIRTLLPRDIIMADWQYNCLEEFKTSHQLADDGFEVVTCPWNIKANVTAAIDTAKKNGYFGTLGTTWHTLSSMQWLIPHLANKMWGESAFTDQELQLANAYHVRRCVPANGVYEDAGFYEEELPSFPM